MHRVRFPSKLYQAYSEGIKRRGVTKGLNGRLAGERQPHYWWQCGAILALVLQKLFLK